jgi:thiol:disulfide interchange protein DsbD
VPFGIDLTHIGARLSGSPATALALLFVAGVLTSLTPCIYPMIPITAAIVGGQSIGGHATRHRPSRGVALTMSYVIGLSLVYALLGLLAGMTRTLFGSVSASPWAAIVTANLLLACALWMLDLIRVPIPAFLNRAGIRQGGVGSIASAFGLGCASGLVAAPCSAPVLAGVLTWVATTKSALLGFAYLFVFSLGMCAVLVAVGLFGSSFVLLPKSGKWMIWIKRGLAIVLLVAAEYYFVRAGTTL